MQRDAQCIRSCRPYALTQQALYIVSWEVCSMAVIPPSSLVCVWCIWTGILVLSTL